MEEEFVHCWGWVEERRIGVSIVYDQREADALNL